MPSAGMCLQFVQERGGGGVEEGNVTTLVGRVQKLSGRVRGLPLEKNGAYYFGLYPRLNPADLWNCSRNHQVTNVPLCFPYKLSSL